MYQKWTFCTPFLFQIELFREHFHFKILSIDLIYLNLENQLLNLPNSDQ